MRYRVLTTFLLLLVMSPKAGASPIYTFPVPATSGCTPHYARYHHDYPANDILVRKGCKYVAVTSGTIDEIRKVDTYNYKKPTGDTKGGIFVSFIGDDGVRYYGSHLQKIAAGIEVGLHVESGALLGFVGDSGDARGTAPHVHFGISWPTSKPNIWWVRRGEIYPWRYLDKWKVGIDSSPAKELSTLLAKKGEIPPIPAK
jgi:hypothetical protein